MRVYFYDEKGDYLDEATFDRPYELDDRITLDKVFTVVWAGGFKLDASKNVLFQPVMLRPDAD